MKSTRTNSNIEQVCRPDSVVSVIYCTSWHFQHNKHQKQPVYNKSSLNRFLPLLITSGVRRSVIQQLWNMEHRIRQQFISDRPRITVFFLSPFFGTLHKITVGNAPDGLETTCPPFGIVTEHLVPSSYKWGEKERELSKQVYHKTKIHQMHNLICSKPDQTPTVPVCYQMILKNNPGLLSYWHPKNLWISCRKSLPSLLMSSQHHECYVIRKRTATVELTSSYCALVQSQVMWYDHQILVVVSSLCEPSDKLPAVKSRMFHINVSTSLRSFNATL